VPYPTDQHINRWQNYYLSIAQRDKRSREQGNVQDRQEFLEPLHLQQKLDSALAHQSINNNNNNNNNNNWPMLTRVAAV
jgi:hypothetical protein